jgi:DnaJ-class molecular chaperone
VPSQLREPKPPYDDRPEEKTPVAPERRSQRCRICWGTGRIHLRRDGKDVGRSRRCPACRGAGWVILDEG